MALDSRAEQDGLSVPRIVGIVLVRNEDLFVERAVRNAAGFCDELLLVDHGSKDQTPAIFTALAAELPATKYVPISHPSQSHDLIKGLAGTATWIFAVDGDEIYDPIRLQRLRQRLLTGEFARDWMILGNVLNVTALEGASATGHLAPPCRSMTKLYNFEAIESWDGDTPERLHGGTVKFRPGFENHHRKMMHEELAWEDSDFRCLHVCFLRRSSLDTDAAARQNIMETYGASLPKRLWRSFTKLLGSGEDWKYSRYRRGPAVTKNVADFFPASA